MVASPLQGCHMEWGLIQHSLPEPELSISELDGLNVNITVPSLENESLDSGRKLPVVVFIHGGGFAVGSNSWPQYSLARMVKLSAAMGSPIIGVGIKCELYPYGPGGLVTDVFKVTAWACLGFSRRWNCETQDIRRITV